MAYQTRLRPARTKQTRQFVKVAAASEVMRQLFTANQVYHAEVHVRCRRLFVRLAMTACLRHTLKSRADDLCALR
jgi:hypothetical protein